MQRFVFAALVFTCVLNVNSYVVQQENNSKDSPDQEAEYNPQRKRGIYGVKNKRSWEKQAKQGESLDEVVGALNTGIKKLLEKGKKSDVIDKYVKQIFSLFSHHAHGGENKNYKYDNNKKISHHERSPKKFDLNAKVLSDMVSSFLKSRTFQDNFDHFVRQAGVVYRTVLDSANENRKN